MSWWNILGWTVCVMSLVCWATSGQAQTELSKFAVIPAYAPNAALSPSWADYVLNAHAGIVLGQDVGDRASDPAAYQRVTGAVPASEMIYTPFNSWRGKAQPNAEFVAPFLGEFGNRVHFGLHVIAAPKGGLALHDLSWQLESDDEGGYFNQSGDFSDADYSATRIGIDYGPDGEKGGDDDTIINSGPGSQLVQELIYVGIGEGFRSFDPDAVNDQADIDATLAALGASCSGVGECAVNLTATYRLPAPGGDPLALASASVKILLIPEPSSSLLVGGAVVGFGLVRRRRKR